MAITTDNNDCYTLSEYYNNHPEYGHKFIYVYVTKTTKREGYIDDPDRHFIDYDYKHESYRVRIPFDEAEKGSCYFTNDPQDSVSQGYWTEENHYVEPSSSVNDIIEAYTIYGKSNGTIRCWSSTSSDPRGSTNDTWFNYGRISFVGSFQRLRNANGEVDYVYGRGNIYRDYNGSIEEKFTDTDNGKSGQGSNTHVTTTYDVEITLHDQRYTQVMYNLDVILPSIEAWKRDVEIDWIKGDPNLVPEQIPYDYQNPNLASWYMDENQEIRSGLLPDNLPWGYPYPYSKWYRDQSGNLTNRGLPEAMAQINGYIGSKKLIKIYIGSKPVQVVYVGSKQV